MTIQALLQEVIDGDNFSKLKKIKKIRGEISVETAYWLQLYGKDCEADGTCSCGNPIIRFDHIEYDGEAGSYEPFYMCLKCGK